MGDLMNMNVEMYCLGKPFLAATSVDKLGGDLL